MRDLTTEIEGRCRQANLKAPGRNTVARRWAESREEATAALAAQERFQRAPGSFEASRPLEMVQVDHTQADVFVADPLFRKVAKRPWISLAIDIATRCVVGVYLSLDRPSSATVALLLTRVVLPKAPWLDSLGVAATWPMHGIPEAVHLDNAAEFHGKALKTGVPSTGSPGCIGRWVGRRSAGTWNAPTER